MTRRERLIENYEDAFFALLMDQVAEEEGARLLEENERLKNSPEAEVPDDLDMRCHQTIKRAFSKNKRRFAVRIAYRAVNKVAMIALVGALMFSAVYAASPEIRVRTLNLLIEASDVATSLRLTGQDEQGNETIEGTEYTGDYQIFEPVIPKIPDGFTLKDKNSGKKTTWIEYSNKEGNLISLCVSDGEDAVLNVDTENASNVENILVHGYSGLFIEKKDQIQIVWGDTQQNKFFAFIFVGVERTTVLNLIEGIEFSEKK